MTTDGLDPEAFRHLLDITGGDLAFVDELIDTYIDDATVQLEAMREAAADRRRRGDGPAGPQPQVEQRERRGDRRWPRRAGPWRPTVGPGAIDDAVARVAACEAAFEAAKAGLLAERTTR